MAVIDEQASVTLDHILCATDFSDASDAALSYAQALARRFAARLTVANVIDLSIATRAEPVTQGLTVDEMRQYGAQNMERTLDQLHGSGINFDGRTLESHRPAEAVLRMADREVDLLVVGTESRRGLQKLLLGSFAEEIIHHASCPVLTIGPHVEPSTGNSISFAHILYATDLQHHAVEKAAIALAFAQDSVARIYLCHIIEGPTSNVTDSLNQEFGAEAALRSLIPNAAYDWCDPDCDVEFGDPAKRILQFATKTEADLIVMGARPSASWLTHMVRGVVANVIAEAKCPVMTICAN